MENFDGAGEKQRFADFTNTVEERVNDLGAKRGTGARAADAVIEHLYRTLAGDATKVTDDAIADAFDLLDSQKR